MNIEHLINKGKQLIEQNKLPDNLINEIEILPNYKEDIVREIFKQEFIDYSNQTIEIKNRRRILMELKSSFDDYLKSFEILNKLSLLLLFLGFIILLSSILGFNSNLLFGIITIIQGGVIFIISIKIELSKKLILPLIIITSILLILEFLVLGLPAPLLEYMQIVPLLNIVTPYFYIIMRFLIIGFIIKIYLDRLNFFKLKNSFEKTVVNKVYTK